MQEVRHDGIRVAYVMPGSVNTNFGGHQTAGAEWKLSPDDVAEVVVDLLGHPDAKPAESRRDSAGKTAEEGVR
jgi:short-subunit dehydrogenase